MRTIVFLACVTWLTACARPAPAVPEGPKSYSEHLDEAAEHEQVAATHDRAAETARGGPETYVCGDRALSDQSRSGTEPVTTWVPCWSVEREASAAHEAEAARQRAEAQQHRAIARALVDVERTFCANITDDELTHTPFFHRSDVAKVEAYREGDRLVGARVAWKTVPGLTADYLRQALLCHRARMATLGYPPTYMSYDPAVLPSTHLAVDQRQGQLTVTIRADDEVTAAVVWARAEALTSAAK